MSKLFVKHMECEPKELLFSKLAPLGHLNFNLRVKKKKLKILKFHDSLDYGVVTLAFPAQMMNFRY